MKIRHIKGFDGVRGVAVITVVLTHAGALQTLEGSALLPLLHGGTGVRAFFVLSGFLITRLLLQEYERNGRISYRAFIARRALRIFPLYLLFIAIVSVLLATGLWTGKKSGLAYAGFYAYNFVPQALYDPLLGHTWSLAVEEHFYLLWPLILAGLATRRLSAMLVASIGMLSSGIAWFTLYRWTTLPHEYFVDRWTLVAAFPLLLGCFAALFNEKRERNSRRLSGVFLALAFALFSAPALVELLPALAGRFSPAYFAARAQDIGIAVFLVWILRNQDGTVVAALEWLPMRYLGRISYGVYVWQGFFLATGPSRSADSIWPPSSSTGLLCLLVIAPLSYHLFEIRFLRMKARFASDRSAELRPSGRSVQVARGDEGIDADTTVRRRTARGS